MNIELITGILALLISVFSLFVSIYFNYKDHERRRKQSTIEYFENITSKLFEIEAVFNSKITRSNENINIGEDADKLKKAINILVAFEQLSVGVNAGIYDFDILERMAGSYLINIFSMFTPYIQETRKDSTHSNSYIEFEHLVNKIKEKRNPISNRGNI